LNFTSQQVMLLGLRPDAEPYANEQAYCDLYLISQDYTVTSTGTNSVSVSLRNIENFGVIEAKGSYVLHLTNDADETKQYDYTFYNISSGTYLLEPLETAYFPSKTVNLSSLPAGTYTAYAGFVYDGCTTANPIRFFGGASFWKIVKSSSGSIRVSSLGVKNVPSRVENTSVSATKRVGIYDLSGRKLNAKPSHGYYIEGGKKHFVGR